MNKLSKLTISIGLGGKTSKQVGDIKTHFQTIFASFLNDRHAVTTKCRQSNSLFKIRQGTPIGIKCTFRKQDKLKLIQHLLTIYPDFYNMLNYDANSLSFGIKSHRKLKLENYNHKAPEYGIIFQIKIEPPGARIKYRRINPLSLKKIIDKDKCISLIKEYVEH